MCVVAVGAQALYGHEVRLGHQRGMHCLVRQNPQSAGLFQTRTSRCPRPGLPGSTSTRSVRCRFHTIRPVYTGFPRLVFVDESSSAVAALDAEGLKVEDGVREWSQRRGLAEGAVGQWVLWKASYSRSNRMRCGRFHIRVRWVSSARRRGAQDAHAPAGVLNHREDGGPGTFEQVDDHEVGRENHCGLRA